ncbi:MAG: hypothetical protein EHM59_07320 [Betaproteobacteria bacterium]|nr:MAG: hypothetical protein EHM59_07320 [Betaproteobacteria bacterium]
MMVTFTLTDVGVGTDVLAVHDNVPSGVVPADNEAGWREALDKLAALVEAGHGKMLEFRVGDRVSFEPDGRPPLLGVLVRYNKKTAKFTRKPTPCAWTPGRR